MKDSEIDPSQHYVFSRDSLRVDVGLIIQRPPVFLRMREKEMNFMKVRQDFMENYFCDTKQFIEEFNEVGKLNEDVL
jgi:hypothetical protein